ncbi:MAG: hypothetical protein R2883_07640 [Caldisericia bacterium]
MKNKITVVLITVLLIIFIGGAVSLGLVADANENLVGQTSYASENALAFVQFDLEYNAQDLIDDVKLIIPMFEDLIDEEIVGLLDFDYSFIDLAGFYVLESFNEVDYSVNTTFGLRLSGEGEPETEIKSILDYLEEIFELEIEYTEEGYMIIDNSFTIFQAEDYILFAPDTQSIEFALDIKNNEKPTIADNPNWKKVESDLSKNFSFLFNFPSFMDESSIPVAGTYINPSKNEYGLELILIDGREQLEKIFSFDVTGEIASNISSLFDQSRDLSDVISYLPDTGVRGAMAGIPCFDEYFTTVEFLEGSNGFWLDLDDEYLEKNGLMYEATDMEPKELLLRFYPEKKFHYEETEDGFELYRLPYRFDPSEDEFDITDKTPDMFCQIDESKIYVVSDESMKQETWEKSEFKETGDSVAFFEIDYGELLESMASTGGMDFGIDPTLLAGIIKEADVKIDIRLFELKPNIKLDIITSGDFEMLSELVESLLP